ncbi:conserved hypothetical protein (plasmid) [Borreliella burgdorferi 29805]|nr:conserved hypothetical protein [Borreliella burgdorferi 29805]
MKLSKKIYKYENFSSFKQFINFFLKQNSGSEIIIYSPND